MTADYLGQRQTTPDSWALNNLTSLFGDNRRAATVAKRVNSLLKYTPLGAPQAGYDAGQMIGGGVKNRSALQAGAGFGMAALGALPGRMGSVLKDIRPPTDNLHTVLRSNFNSAKVIGDEMTPIENLVGGITGSPSEQARVKQLASQMSSPAGYFSRLIIDQDGNVIEGQHRLEAARALGFTHVPTVRVVDMEAGLPVTAMKAAMESAGKIHPDHQTQIVGMIGDLMRTEGSARAIAKNYDAPAGYRSQWDAALKAVMDSQRRTAKKK